LAEIEATMPEKGKKKGGKKRKADGVGGGSLEDLYHEGMFSLL
jgi:hypothetical protein